MDPYDGGWWIAMWIGMATFGLVVLGAVAWFMWQMIRLSAERSSAHDMLEERLARGEIDVEQYRTLSRELGNASQPRKGGNAMFVWVAAAILVFTALVAAPAIAMAATHGDWGMFGHMGVGAMMGGGGQNTANAPLTVGSDRETVTVNDSTFSPGNLQVSVGATVTWLNRDSATHNATARDGSWKTANLSTGESDTITFNQAGEFDYRCSLHPSMQAHLSVK